MQCIETDEYSPKIFPEVSLVYIWGGMINFKNWYNLDRSPLTYK